MKKHLFLLIFSVFVFPFSAECLAQTLDADRIDSSGFRAVVTGAEKTCEKLRCPSSPVQAHTLSHWQSRAILGNALLQKLRETCQTIAENEWPETILDGPYVASFSVQISHIELLTYDQGVLGYRVTYVDKAWNIESCNYDPRHPDTINQCRLGKFVESAFISAKTGEAFRDPNGYVDFTSTSPTRNFHF